MDFDGGYKALGQVSESLFIPLKEAILASTLWDADTRRQDTFKVHEQTKSIVLKFSNDPYGEYDPAWENWKGLVRPVIDEILMNTFKTLEGGYVKVILALMPSGTVIHPHRDEAIFWKYSHRIHVPIITNDKVTFIIDGVTVPPQEGQAFEIANTRLHSVKNEGPTRIHLIFDYVEPETATEWDNLIKMQKH